MSDKKPYPNNEQRRTILHRAFEKQMDTGEPHGTVAINILNRTRRETALIDPETAVREVSERISQGRVVVSSDYVDSVIKQLSGDERAQALVRIYETGPAIEAPSPFASLRGYH